jgi:hypothetical protein
MKRLCRNEIFEAEEKSMTESENIKRVQEDPLNRWIAFKRDEPLSNSQLNALRLASAAVGRPLTAPEQDLVLFGHSVAAEKL